ncbi:hypothetical protein HYFRA_00012212 [Hymenoscyphus fraxineus]|uniref:BTB domain-containing protein n=1 Tax=Hymenoscyphus fraxineus TaxID=746836 RepID=A0A9N9L1W1_9HELO|nr:hypothetical protein HYFRA_00012212 [Hymenoscyphus fraxineus]
MSKRDASGMSADGESAGKKIKADGGPKPIIFTSPGSRTTDTRIVVFNQEFHVSSESLRILSVYFKKFLDPINAPDRKPASFKFKYEWFTRVDDDGMWGLSSDPKDRDLSLEGFKGNSVLQENCFHNLLRAMFCRQSVVSSVEELGCLVEMADFYLCLPAVSNSLYETTINNQAFSRSIASYPCLALNCAYELRHALLFREAMIHCLGPVSKPRYKELISDKLRALCAYFESKMTLKLHAVDNHLRLIQANKEVYGDVVHKFFYSTLSSCYQPGPNGEEGTMFYPQYYRRLINGNARDKLPDNLIASIRRALEPINKNLLRLDTMRGSFGIGDFKDAFLCYEVLDSDLPWDREQQDWGDIRSFDDGLPPQSNSAA